MDGLATRAAFVTELTKVNRKLRTMFDARVREQGLTLARARLLLHLAKSEGKNATQKDLAETLEVEQPSMVSLIDALEKKGFVTREAVEGDRRVRHIVLTPHARAETAKVMQYAEDLHTQILAGIDDADLAVAARVLAKIAHNIGAAG